ncbi:MAG: ORF6N domain-containing protein [Bacteroidales bacterium]
MYEIRGQKIMLDFDLATLYEVETRALKQAVKRNIERFPSDFMFELTKEEWKLLTSQIVIFEKGQGKGKYPKYLPFAFTEQGVSMLSTVLRSKTAIQVNIAIMRAFVVMRQYYMNYKELKLQIEKLEKEMNLKFKDIYEALKYLLEPPRTPRKQIGYKTPDSLQGRNDE